MPTPTAALYLYLYLYPHPYLHLHWCATKPCQLLLFKRREATGGEVVRANHLSHIVRWLGKSRQVADDRKSWNTSYWQLG